MSAPFKIFVSAAEISSDLHASMILNALLKKLANELEGRKVEVGGIGGPQLRSIAGFKSIVDAESLRTMGISEVLRRYGYFKKVLDQAVETIEQEKPDLILTFDYPDFHLRLMARLKERNIAQSALKICGIPPKVWVWRMGRVEKIRELYDGVWVLFPFERNFYEARGIPVIEEGNPMLSRLVEKKSEPAKIHFNADTELPIAVMPGSRPAEWDRLISLIHPTLSRVAGETKKTVRAWIPVPEGLNLEHLKEKLKDDSKVKYEFFVGGTAWVLSQARLGLIKSGTSTLEAVVLGCDPIIFYRMSPFTEWFFTWIIRYNGPVGLPNILLGFQQRKATPFPELLGPDATVEKLSAALIERARNPLQNERWMERVRSIIKVDAEVSNRIAEKIISWILVKPKKLDPAPRKLWIGVGSFFWSLVNFIRRRLSFPKKIPLRSILVGNLQAGGSGKTPTLIAIAREAIQRGWRVAVISRGYGARHGTGIRIAFPGERNLDPLVFGDEPCEIKNELPDAYLGVGSNRIDVYEELIKQSKSRNHSIDLLLFDDGFQNLKFKPTFTLLLRTPLESSQTLYRDFQSEAKFADLTLDNPGPLLEWEPESLPSTPIWLLAGVANPDRLVQFYRNRGVKITNVIATGDHAEYSIESVKDWKEEASKHGATLMTTGKDSVKLPGMQIPTLKVKLKHRAWIHDIFDRLH